VQTQQTWRDLLGRYPFCRIVTFDPVSGAVETSRIPLVAGEDGDGSYVTGHVARSNPQWKLWQAESTTACLIDGADAYISPSWYDRQPAVSTWNHCSATLIGQPQLITNANDQLASLLELISAVDPALHTSLGARELAHYRRILAGIVGFRMVVERAEHHEKVSAHRSAEDRAAISRGIESRGAPSDLEYLSMLQWLHGPDSGVE
jgi:transcriptional regulator